MKLPRVLEAEPPETLAALRIVVPLMVLSAPGLREGVRVARLDHALYVVPEGLGWFVRVVPIHPWLAIGVELVTVLAALLATVGLRARPALLVLTLGAFYLFSIAQLTGFVWHDMHLLWMCALLAASPCDHALAFDRRPPAPASLAYGVPLLFARLLLGAVYFFPGVHKLAQQGLGWALSDNLRNQLWWKWAEHGTVPAFRIDHHPWLLHGGGLFVLGFELAAPVLFLWRPARPVAAVLGLLFHLLAQAIFLIPFVSLWACYVVLFDVRRALGWLQRGPRPGGAVAGETAPREASSRRLVTLLVGAALVTGAVVQGARGQMQSYPFACYPTFQWRPATVMPDLRARATLRDGHEVDVHVLRDARGHRSQRQWGVVWALAGATHPVSPERLHAFAIYLARTDPTLHDATRVRLIRADVSVVPEARDQPPVREQDLATFDL